MGNLDIKYWLEEADRVIELFNPYHDKATGRFTSKSGSSSGTLNLRPGSGNGDGDFSSEADAAMSEIARKNIRAGGFKIKQNQKYNKEIVKATKRTLPSVEKNGREKSASSLHDSYKSASSKEKKQVISDMSMELWGGGFNERTGKWDVNEYEANFGVPLGYFKKNPGKMPPHRHYKYEKGGRGREDSFKRTKYG